MATISKPYTFSAGATIVAAEHNSNLDTIYNEFNGLISDANISATAAIQDTKLAQISTAQKVLVGALGAASQATGDLIYYNGSSWVRLGIGSSNQALLTVGGIPAWTTGVVTAATQAEQETGTSVAVGVTPGRQHYHNSAAKAWCMFNGATTGTNAPTVGYNVTSVTRNSLGDYTVNLTTAFSSANYAAVVTCQNASSPATGIASAVHHTLATSTYRFKTYNSADVEVDSQVTCVVIFGDL